MELAVGTKKLLGVSLEGSVGVIGEPGASATGGEIMVDSLSWHVMNATADDWESLEQILPQVQEFSEAVQPALVAEVISRLVFEGCLEEMKGRKIQPDQVLPDAIEFWFRMTPKGRAIWNAESAR